MTVQAPASKAAGLAPARSGGLLGALTSTDHKRVGLNLGACSLMFFLVGGLMALIIRAQLAARTVTSCPTTPTPSCSRCTARR